jgi:hypothetical protein
MSPAKPQAASEHSHLKTPRNWVGIEARGAQVSHKFRGAVRAINLRCADALGGFQKLIEVGVIGQGKGVVNSVPVFGTSIHGPAGDKETHGMLNARHAKVFHSARQSDHDMVRFQLAVEDCYVAQVHAARFVNLAHGEDVGMLLYGETGERKNLRDFLRLSQRIGMNHRRATVGECLAHQLQQFVDNILPGWNSVLRFAKRRFHHQDVGLGKFRLFARFRGAELEISRKEKSFLAVVCQQHRRAQAVPRGIGGQRVRAEGNRLAMGEFRGSPCAEPVLIQARRGRRAERQFMPGDVVGMGMRHEADLLSARDVERDPGFGEKQTLIPVKHGSIIAEISLPI